MFNDTTALALCSVTLLLFFIGGATGFLSNPYYLGCVVVIYLIIVVNLFINKQPDIEEKDNLENEL